MNFIEAIIYMLWRGIAIGIIISAPMGPVGILCVQRTLEKGRRTGFFTGIGATISDMFYCLLTGFGLSFIEEFLTRNHDILQLIGSVVLIGFGIYLFKSNPSRKLKKPDEGISDKRNILNGFLFTFSNPLIIFLIIGLFARFNFFVPEITLFHYIIGFIAIGAGALIWWWLVTFFVAKLRSHFNLRSMWLINKIIGSIIFIFAIVGIVTAVTAMTSAAVRNEKPQNIYLNSARGFTGFRNATDSTLIISAENRDTVSDMINLPASEEFELTFRAANINNRSRHPAWGIMITDKKGGFERILIQTSDSPKDETYTPTALHFSFDNGKKISFTDSFDMFSGLNAFSLHFNRGSCVLAGGNREYKPILSWESTIEHPDSIGFFVTPGGAIAIDDLSLEFSEPDFDNELSCFANPDVLHTYLMRSADPNEGVWKLMDYSLDEDALRTGGEYTLAIIRNGKGYDCYYLNGSRVLPDKWKAGMRKATLLDSGFKNIFDVEWVSATGETISKGIKAQLEGSILTIHFPHQDSNIRLRKLPRN